jgi:hypothetical protein
MSTAWRDRAAMSRSIEYGTSGKGLELLKQIAPGVTRAAVIAERADQPLSSFKRAQGQADARHDGIPGALLCLGIHKVETVNGTAAPFGKVATAV